MTDEQTQAPSSWEQSVMQNVLLESIKEQRRSRRWGIFFKGITLFYFFLLLFLFWSPSTNIEHQQNHIGVVDLYGTIGADEEANAATFIEGLRDAFNAPNSSSLILRINSPGGSPVQSNYIYTEIRRLKAKYPEKKVYAVIEDMGASGAYFVAAGADEIYADASSIVGSIGVLMPSVGIDGLIEKIGVSQRSLMAGENKLFYDPMSPVMPEQKAHAEELIGFVHKQFIDAVKEGRGDRLKDDPSIFSGLFWTGTQSLDLGLIDGFGSAGFVARDVIGNENVVNYTVQGSVFSKLSKRMGTSLSHAFGLNQSTTPQLIAR